MDSNMIGKIIKNDEKYFIEYKKDLFDGIFFYPEYSTETIEITNFSNDFSINDMVEFEVITIADGITEFDVMDKDVAKIIKKI